MCDTLLLIASPEACLEPSQTSAMKTFVKTANGYFFIFFYSSHKEIVLPVYYLLYSPDIERHLVEENIYYFSLFFILIASWKPRISRIILKSFKHNYIQQNFGKATIFHDITQWLFVKNQIAKNLGCI